jgi:predicted DsbA family dithiol-disulfide isomerase
LRQEYDLEVEHCAFELHPGIPLEGQPIPWPPQRLAAARSHFEQVAAAEALEYGPRSHWYNSEPAHQAALWADEHGDGDAFRRSVYRAYFAGDLNIASTDVLASVAAGLELDSDALRVALADGRYRTRVQEQFEFAREAGVTGVPAYVAGRYMLVGAQSYDVYRQLIETAQSEAETLTPLPP